MLKRITLFSLVLSLFVSCSGYESSSENLYENIPVKNDIDGVSIEASSVNTQNIDNYLFREDVVYVDLRPYAEIMKQGHIAGFSFYPFYEFIATNEVAKDENGNPINNRLFSMKDERGKMGQVGNFVPNYVESEQILYSFFPKDKYIFALTISCNESMYFLNLLKQYDYNPAHLYNIGGFSIGTGLENKAYINIDNPKYLVRGNGFLQSYSGYTTFDFMKDLTPINIQ